jgi:3-oxoacyl-[acyl-carrier protein] reductase
MAIAAALAAAGVNIVVNHNHQPELARGVVTDIRAAGGTALAIAADVTSRAEYHAMVEQMLAEFGRWDILVNNAAAAITKPSGEITEDEFDLSFAVNVKGAFHGLRLAWDHLADGARIITISSWTTALMLPGYAVYNATKGVVEQFTHILSQGIRPLRDNGERGQPRSHRDRNLPGRQEPAVPGQPEGYERIRPARPAPMRSLP